MSGSRLCLRLGVGESPGMDALLGILLRCRLFACGEAAACVDALLGILLGRPLFACREAAAMLTVRAILFGCRLLAGGEAAARLDELLGSGHGCRRLGWRDGARRGRRDGRLVRLRVVHGSLSGLPLRPVPFAGISRLTRSKCRGSRLPAGTRRRWTIEAVASSSSPCPRPTH